jgi:hypothetical protein
MPEQPQAAMFPLADSPLADAQLASDFRLRSLFPKELPEQALIPFGQQFQRLSHLVPGLRSCGAARGGQGQGAIYCPVRRRN